MTYRQLIITIEGEAAAIADFRAPLDALPDEWQGAQGLLVTSREAAGGIEQSCECCPSCHCICCADSADAGCACSDCCYLTPGDECEGACTRAGKPCACYMCADTDDGATDDRGRPAWRRTLGLTSN